MPEPDLPSQDGRTADALKIISIWNARQAGETC
jgi:hypothetical protein